MSAAENHCGACKYHANQSSGEICEVVRRSGDVSGGHRRRGVSPARLAGAAGQGARATASSRRRGETVHGVLIFEGGEESNLVYGEGVASHRVPTAQSEPAPGPED